MVASADRGVAALLPVMVAACVLQAVALVVARIELMAFSIVVVGAAFVASHDAGPSAVAVALFAGALLLVAELATWSFERQTAVFARPGLDASRWLSLVALVAGGVAVAIAVLWLATRSWASGLAFEIAGVTVTAVLLALVVWTAVGRVDHEPRS